MNVRLTLTLMMLTAVLLTALPVSAQDTARVRFANLRAGSTGLDITDQEGGTLATMGPFGSVTGFIDVDASLTGLGFSVIRESGFSTSVTAGFDPIFTAGNEYLVLTIGDDEEDTSLIIDLTTEFGGADAVVDDGLGRLLVIYYVRELTSGAFTLQNADGTLLGSYFLAPDTSGFEAEADMLSVALAPGDYTFNATAANDPSVNLMPPQSLTLAADEITVLGVAGSYPDAVRALLVEPDGVTNLSE